MFRLQPGWLSEHHDHGHGNGHGHEVPQASAPVDPHIVDLPGKQEDIDMVALERARGRTSFSVGSDEQNLGDIVRTRFIHI